MCRDKERQNVILLHFNLSRPKDPGRRAGTCRVCLKSFKPEEFFKMCSECQQKVCEDCASYSKLDENQDETTWSCSICRRKRQSRNQPAIAQEFTDSLLDVPVLEALQRRHSDIKIGSGSSGSNAGVLEGGLAPPRSPELRRHSDVSPASLKEIEKRNGLTNETSMCTFCERLGKIKEIQVVERKAHSQIDDKASGEISLNEKTMIRAEVTVNTFLFVARINPKLSLEVKKVAGDRRDELRWERELEWRKKGAPTGGSKAASPLTERRPFQDDGRYPQQSPAAEGNNKEEEDGSAQKGNRNRRKSRIGRQHSYDDEIKNASSSQFPASEPALGLPVALPRRASAYDVFAFRQGETVGGPPGHLGANANPQTGRRASFRVVSKQDDPPPYDAPTPVTPETAAVSGLVVDDDRRTRRRGSQLPDISNIRGLHQAVPQKPPPRVNENLINSEAVRRQASCDGEAIKIVIDDVDSDATFARGFGMRVVGGKASVDGRLFAYIVWTVPGGPAEKAGLQQGDKILEWCGVSLIDRSFEEVCSVMDRTRDVAELLVEHANDL
ncbi:hypothetical protein RUM44_004895 [Polyplax serrata]|uniref:PDZ domain-containing protein n=1 Tax=Polyplax serrata TaxID=468196 RepID=A0ABR1B426_POLSC